MATNKALRHTPKKGPPSIDTRSVHIEDKNGDGFRLPANLLSQLLEKNMAPIIGGGFNRDYGTSLTVPGWTVVTGGTGDATAFSTTGGLLITLASDDNFDFTASSVLTVTPTAGKWYSMVSRLTVSGATALGFKLGLTTGGAAQALPFGTEYTDQVTISKAIASANVVGMVTGNDNADEVTGTLGAISTTEVEVGFAVYVHATNPAGYFSYKTAAAEKPTITPMTTAQLAQVVLLLTSPQTLYWTIHATGVTGTNPTLDIASFFAGGDR